VDVRRHNQLAWDAKVRQKDQWTCPVDEETIDQARQGQWQILLTPTRPVPQFWLGDVTGLTILCLASGGGQQAPILAAVGANVTVLDNSPLQLKQDRRVAQTHRLSLKLIEGDMTDLSMFDKETFDLIIHPLSNCFVPDVRPVWSETFRIVRPGGTLLSGFCNPVRYIFDYEFERRGELKVRHSLPYSDLTSLSEVERKQLIADGQPLEFGHTLEDQIGGQLDAGFLLTGFFEDRYGSERNDPISNVMATFVATRVIKPKL
jgi:SAM-dependent methyltransferase